MTRGWHFFAIVVFVILGVSPAALAQGGGELPLAAQDLLDQYPGLRVRMAGGTPRAFYGRPMTEAATPTEAADKWLTDHGAAFGVENLDLRPTDTSVLLSLPFNVFAYQQFMDGLPVEGGIGRLMVVNGATRSVFYAAANLAQTPEGSFAPDTVSAADALTLISNMPEYAHLDQWSTPEMVILYKNGDGELSAPVRVWKFQGVRPEISSTDDAYSFFVDAASGQLSYARSEVHHASSHIQGKVEGVACDGIYPDIPSHPLTTQTLPTLRVQLIEGCDCPSCAAPDCNTERWTLTDGSGNYSFDNVTFPASVRVDLKESCNLPLEGPWVQVNDASSQPFDLKLCAYLDQAPPADVDFLFNDGAVAGDPTYEFSTAQANAFIHVTKAHDFYKSRQPDFTALDVSIECRVNRQLTGPCNATYSGGALNFGPEGVDPFSGVSCSNAAYSDTIAHEYGHFVYAELQITGSFSFSEGFADAFALLEYDVQVFGQEGCEDPPGTFKATRDYTCTEIVDCGPGISLQYPIKYPCTLVTDCPTTPRCSTECWDHGVAYGCARILAGVWVQVNQELQASYSGGPGLTIAQQLFTDWSRITLGQDPGNHWNTAYPGTLIEALIVDDARYGDADLSNGTPHDPEILAAFEFYNIYYQILYVDADASGANAGSSWADAYTDLQDALTDAANNTGFWTEIRVAQGTYKPTADTDRTKTFVLPIDAAIWGGYYGCPAGDCQSGDPNERNIVVYETILSGDLLGNDDSGQFPNGPSHQDNSFHVVRANSPFVKTILDGFTITGGNANGSVGNESRGGGLYSTAGAPTVENCKFVENYGVSGGGVNCFNSWSPELANNLFIRNEAENGGGVYTAANNSVRIVNCTFSANTADSNGGGVYVSGADPVLTLTNCILWGNSDIGGVDESAQVFYTGNPPAVNYSCIQGLSSLVGASNIGDDPVFLDDGNDNYRLSRCSPCIDAGDNTAVPGDVGSDLDGASRFVDDPATPDTGNGTAPIVDMGAYEFQPSCGTFLGDITGDGVVAGDDIQGFVECLIAGDIQANNCVCADMNLDDAVGFPDVPCFVYVLLGDTSCTVCSTGQQRVGLGDCNNNGTPDEVDIFLGTSQDCNANFIPDECDVDPADPDGDGQVSNDLNANGIPDECEPDCNANGIPDDKDIADATSADLNANGIPDECDPDCNANGIPDEMDIDPTDPDGNGQVSPDCNGNGEPDECDPDCNANGVPDECDIDPTDPDGNGQVSPDCNSNGFPDSCDMALLPPFGSLDCNANGIPDECDIASGTSQDCNANGFPDECDIATGISQDTNANGIPDKCEAQQSQGGGGSSSTPTATASTLSESETEQAYTEFLIWSLAQQWGPNAPRTGNQQFQAMVDKLRELGLPLETPYPAGP